MKKTIWLLAVSITANVVMAGLWLRHHTDNDAAAFSTSTSSVGEKTGGRIASDSSTDTTATGITPAGESSASSSTANWKDLQSANLKEMIRRLRAAGCPEETIRDMILAEVNRRFAVKQRDLWPDEVRNSEYWKVQKARFDSEAQKKQRERMKLQRDLQKEKTALLVDLLGVDPEKQIRVEEGFDEAMVDRTEQGVSFLPEAKRESVSKYLADWQDKISEFYTTNQGMFDAQYRADEKMLEEQKMAGLSRLLTPEEMREYELRQSKTANNLSSRLQTLDITREQYESLFDISKKYGDSIYNWGGDNNTEAKRKEIEQNQKNMSTEIASTLGADFGKQYERAGDYSYQQLTRAAKRYDLPADTANKVYDFKQTAEDSANKLRQDKNLTFQQQQEMLQKIRTETDTTLKQTLGDKAYKSYMKNGGWWLNNISPPVSRTAPAPVPQ